MNSIKIALATVVSSAILFFTYSKWLYTFFTYSNPIISVIFSLVFYILLGFITKKLFKSLGTVVIITFLTATFTELAGLFFLRGGQVDGGIYYWIFFPIVALLTLLPAMFGAWLESKVFKVTP